ncbi:ABC transporter permease [Sinorhizobium meliloti]|uniref:ABC transporter permease n=1 Tax=Rhizobium meliloti TaxID=382 RepID=UPI00040CB895|nr:ABC transporter permease [Sinorhizobium meliloti]MDW9356463.1 ABC transporter permease [Sinorhizobium meliloti]MDW9655391.1 ABC transporter permease [Sinorhizobium meliloti]MDW9915179.1 ABC transporter permease [Sinorhizobium meliloti]MDW9939786.1 ABC transporter permease [Sinorhizobium meliloti]MDW9946381.1 ABC transporter permease [Sinorhizobium meliloti]
MITRAETIARTGSRADFSPVRLVKQLFVRAGVLPFFLVIAVIIFSLASSQFLTLQNLTNVARQSVYLVLVSLGQMLVLITGGFDLSVGTAIALTSVVSASTMIAVAALFPDLVWFVIALGLLAGFGAALIVGVVNGIGVSVFGVSPFIMTLGVQSVGAGTALFLTGGVPIGNLPYEFGNFFGFGRVAGVPVPVVIALLTIAVMWVVMNRLRIGTQFYAVGGNVKAAHLSGINTKVTLFVAYVACSLLASLAGILLTARVESGETNLGGTVGLESIAACVIAGVSLRGGIGRVENVVLGAFFIVLVQNGMNVMQIGSYMQMVLLGSLLILAVIIDQLRYRMILARR